MKTKLTVSLLLIGLFVFLGVRFMQLVFSESEDIEPNSVSSFVLIPGLLKAPEIEQIGTVSGYYYSAADGPKPAVYSANIATDTDRETLDKQITQYFRRQGFSACDQGLMCKDSLKMSYSLHSEAGKESSLKIELLDFL